MFKTRCVDALELGCRLHHHIPTSYEVGMRENLTRTRFGSLTLNSRLAMLYFTREILGSHKGATSEHND